MRVWITVENRFQRTDPPVTIWNLSGGIIHVPSGGIVLVIRRGPAQGILQSWRERCEFPIRHIVISISKVQLYQNTDFSRYRIRGQTYSFQMVVQTSCSVTPRSFLTIVHHGEDSQITTSSWTRGSVAGSSLAVKGRSLSRASGLNPEVEPVSPQKVWKGFSSDYIELRTRRTCLFGDGR